MNKQLESLMQKEMTRKEFLAAVGFGIASILGFSSVIKFLTGKRQDGTTGAGSAYGRSAYGR